MISQGNTGGAAMFPGGNPNGPPTGTSPDNTLGPGGNRTAPAPLPISSQPSPAGGKQPTQSLTFAEVENYWMKAGGSPQAAAMAAAVADSESGMNPNATRTNPDGTVSVGLWLTPQNGMPPGSTDPLASARGAVQLSNNGTDWTQWCSTWSDNNCGENNGTYLGSGSNALMSLGTQAASYDQFGSTPAGDGTGASAASTGVGSQASSGSGHTLILVVGIVLAVILVIYISRKKSQEGGAGSAPRVEAEDEGATGTGIGTHTVRVPAHVRQVRNP